MFRELTSFTAFHVRCMWKSHPLAFGITNGTVVLFIVALGVCVEQWSAGLSLKREYDALAVSNSASVKMALPEQIALSDFESAKFVAVLHRASENRHVPIEEITFSVDDSGNQPFLRYKAAMTVSGNYATIRSYLDQVRSEITPMSLDSITCARTDIDMDTLLCDLSLSAFYRKAAHG